MAKPATRGRRSCITRSAAAVSIEIPVLRIRPLTKLLKREGWVVNHKRVLRMMREDNLLSLRRKKFVVTTQSDLNRQVYPNLARRMKVSGRDQLWVADITYIRLKAEFIYLAVIL